ncbi:helix-turn-helix domain-containing protein [Streptomyces fragilis]|uniref:XRE family transcriptional regulator n=1 Tax=Streptomyces fragilis TaxID=67301 RepID=A0ABV2YE02_9ACTN|nr:XRE family transcriptional regulator [Streptomyces fragilis]
MDESVHDRVRKVMDAASLSQAAFAQRVGLTADKLSKSLNGVRRFTSLDLARVAEFGDTTVDWLLSGREPLRPSFAARTTGAAAAARTAGAAGQGRSVPTAPPTAHPAARTGGTSGTGGIAGTEGTEGTGGTGGNAAVADSRSDASLESLLRRFTGAYEVLEALGRGRPLPELPAPPKGVERFVDQGEALAREALALLESHGVASVAELDTPQLVDVVDQVFGVDVAQVGLPGGVDGVAWHTDAFRLVLLARTDRWTRQRFTLAHELGHVLARDAQQPLAERHLAPGHQKNYDEVRANVFAAGFLMPEREVGLAVEKAGHLPRTVGPDGSDGPVGTADLSEATRAALVVRFQVSPSALAARLHQLGVISGEGRRTLRGMTTEQCHLLVGEAGRLQDRTASAVAERVPSGPARRLYDAYEAAETTLRPLAAYLDREADVLREQLAPEPPVAALPAEEKGDLVFQP